MFGLKLQTLLYGLLSLILIVLVTAGIFYKRGQSSVQEDWDASVERGKTLVAELKGKRDVVTVKTEIQYVERIKVVREKAKTIVEYVNVYVPADAPEFGGGFRVLHDAASSNTLPSPSSIPDAAPVSAQTVARTVAENYGVCHETRLTLLNLQEWVARQASVATEPP